MKRRDFCLSLPLAAGSATLLQGATIPRPAPNVVVTMPNGRPPMQLSQLKGKVIAVEFLLTYCSHCQRASRSTEMVFRDYASKGFTAIGAAINPGGDVVGYVRDHNLSFPVGSVAQEVCNNFMEIPMAGRLLMPQLAFIDRNFQIVAQYSGDNAFFGENEEKNMRQMVENLIGSSSTGGAKKAPAAKKKTT